MENINNIEKKLAQCSKEEIERIEVLIKLSIDNLKISPKKAIEYGEQALELSTKINVKSEKAEALKNIGLAYYYLSDYRKALNYFEESLIIAKEIGNNENIASTLNRFGHIYRHLSNYDQALEYYLKALKIYQELGNEKGIATSLNNIGMIYGHLDEHEKALEYFLKSLKIREEIGDKNGISSSLNNIGICYELFGNYNKALKYYQKSLKIDEELNNKKDIALTLNNIGMIYQDQSNHNKAIDYYYRSLQIKKELGDRIGVANTSTNIGDAYIKLQNFDQALQYLTQGLELAKEIKAKKIIQDGYFGFSDLYTEKKDYKKALEYYKLYTEIKDSIFTDESSKKIAEMQAKYETEKKEKEAEIYRLKNVELAFANSELNQKNKQILKQKIQLSKTLKELRETQKMLTDTAHRAGMAEIATGILHNVGNVLNSVKVSSQILKERIISSKVNSLRQVISLMEEHTDDIGEFITSDEKGKMLPEYLLKVGAALKEEQDNSLEELSTLHKGINHIEEIIAVQQSYAGVSGLVEKVALSDMMNDVLKMHSEIFRKYKINITKKYSKTQPILIEKGKLIQVFVNLLKNAKESLEMIDEKNRLINIKILEEKEHQIIEIVDNGIGIVKKNLGRIFSYGFSTKKDGKGFGLHTSALAMIEMKGKLTAESEGEGKGAKFIVKVPINKT